MSKFPEKYTTETLKEAIHKKHPNIELISEYLGDNDSEITVKCTIHNDEWKTTPHRLSQQKHVKSVIEKKEIEKLMKFKLKNSKIF